MSVTDGTLPLLGVPPFSAHAPSLESHSPRRSENWILNYGYGATIERRSVRYRQDPIVDAKRQIIGVHDQRFRFSRPGRLALITLPVFERNKFLEQLQIRGPRRLKTGCHLEQLNADVARMLPSL